MPWGSRAREGERSLSGGAKRRGTARQGSSREGGAAGNRATRCRPLRREGTPRRGDGMAGALAFGSGDGALTGDGRGQEGGSRRVSAAVRAPLAPPPDDLDEVHDPEDAKNATAGTAPVLVHGHGCFFSLASIAGEVVSVAVLAYVLYQQRQIRPLRTKLLLPLVLAVFGVSNVLSDLKGHPLTSGQAAVIVALLLVDAIGLGTLRAFTVRLWRHDGQVFRQVRWVTVGLWLVGVGVHEAALVATHIDAASLLLYVGLTLGAQRLVLDARARRSWPSGRGSAELGRRSDERTRPQRRPARRRRALLTRRPGSGVPPGRAPPPGDDG